MNKPVNETDSGSIPLNTAQDRAGDDLRQCVVCSTYVEKKELFSCPKCRRSPLCRKHRVSGEKWCASCVSDQKVRELESLDRQEKNIRSFMLFLQFLFIGSAILFASLQFGFTDILEQLKLLAVANGSVYIGIGSVLGYGTCFVLIYNQRKKKDHAESVLRRLKYE